MKSLLLPGINGKMSELNAAFGLLQLKHVDATFERRMEIDKAYRIGLKDIKGITCLNGEDEATTNHSYFPILVDQDYSLSRNALYEKLKTNNIYARRYFYPLISDFPMYRDMLSSEPKNLPVAKDAAAKVLCLPIYPTLSEDDQVQVINIIREGLV